MRNEIVIRAGDIVERLYFLKHGRWHVINKKCQFVISILKKRSFFGDYQILLNLRSNFHLVTAPKFKYNMCLYLEADYFNKLCRESPKTHTFMVERALLRRNHFRNEELRYITSHKEEI